MLLDIHKELSNGTLQDFLEQAKCKPQNCKQNSWDYSVLFEGSHLDDVTGAIGYFEQQKYQLNFYMETPEVSFLEFV